MCSTSNMWYSFFPFFFFYKSCLSAAIIFTQVTFLNFCLMQYNTKLREKYINKHWLRRNTTAFLLCVKLQKEGKRDLASSTVSFSISFGGFVTSRTVLRSHWTKNSDSSRPKGWGKNKEFERNKITKCWANRKQY